MCPQKVGDVVEVGRHDPRLRGTVHLELYDRDSNADIQPVAYAEGCVEGVDLGPDVEVDPEVLGGAPVVKGTRISTRAVASVKESGADPQEAYPDLTEEQVANAEAYEEFLLAACRDVLVHRGLAHLIGIMWTRFS